MVHPAFIKKIDKLERMRHNKRVVAKLDLQKDWVDESEIEEEPDCSVTVIHAPPSENLDDLFKSTQRALEEARELKKALGLLSQSLDK